MRPPRKEEPTANIETGVGLKKPLYRVLREKKNSYLDERERTLTVERKRLLQGREKEREREVKYQRRWSSKRVEEKCPRMPKYQSKQQILSSI